MQHISGISREQIQFIRLEDYISQSHEVRFIDVFVEQLDLVKLGFKVTTLKKEGRPSFRSSVFAKMYLYGYINGIRSSRKLEKEATRNVEMQWLLHGMMPNYHTISDFRKDNPKAIRNLFKMFVLFLKDTALVMGDVVAIDGTKVRASNSKKANYSQKKIDRHISYIDNKTEEYLQAIAEADAQDDRIKVTNIEGKIEQLKERKINYEILSQKLEANGEPQISTTDPDARALLVQGQVVEVSYNMQAAVDAKHNLVIATHTINRNDRNALKDIATEAKENLNTETFTALVDKGYHNGRQIQQCTQANLTTIVACPTLVNSNEKGTTEAYMVDKFVYNKEDDTYTCPQGATLHTKGTWHNKSREGGSYRMKKYRTPDCKTCPVRNLCTARADGGREVERSEFADAVEANNKRYKENQELYKQRQMINEHIFGTIKRQWGYNHTNLRGLEKVNGEHSLIMLVYNMKRSINILGIPKLIENFRNWSSPYKRKGFVLFFEHHLKPNLPRLFFTQKLVA